MYVLNLKSTQVTAALTKEKIENALELTLAPLQILWDRRDPAFRRTTLDYQKQQHRWIWLMAVTHLQRFEAFEKIASHRKWRASTQAAYYQAFLAAQTALGYKSTLADVRNLRHLTHQAAMEIPTAAPPMLDHHIPEMWHTHSDLYSIGLFLAFTWGQRVSDVAKIRISRIAVERGFLRVTFVEGKTIIYTGPYTLYLRSASWLALEIQKAIYSRSGWDSLSLLLPQDFVQVVSVRLAEIGLQIRSVRRGGLQRLSALGTPIDALLKFSHHTTPKMLFRYLGYISWAEAEELTSYLDRAVGGSITQVNTAAPGTLAPLTYTLSQ